MNWLVLLLGLTLVMAYSYLRQRVRRWIVDRWLADRLSNRQVAVLLVTSYALPLIALAVWITVKTPGAALPSLIIMALLGTVLIAGTAGLLEYASVYGVKQRMRKDRAA